MYISKINNGESIEISIPLTGVTGKARVKQRSILNQYGLPVATRKIKFNQTHYIEWQIGYDVVTKKSDKLKLSTLQNLTFIGANLKEKAFYELSEYIKYFYDWKIISENDLNEVELFLKTINENDFLDVNSELGITRKDFINKEILGIKFLYSIVQYPLLVYKFKNYEIITEISIREKQYAVGVQPMLYVCFPITELKNSCEMIGRTANKKEEATFIIDKNNISVFLEMLRVFGTLSKSHNKDILSIINIIKTV